MKTGRMAVLAVMAAALCVSGCKNKAASPAPKTSYTTIDWSTAGTIEGTIHYAGTPPKPIQIDMSQDPACNFSPPNYTEGYVVKDGGMANVFVTVRDGLGDRIYATPTEPVTIDQKGCRYVPHVVGVMVGQPVKFLNSDSTAHNIDITPNVAGNQPVNLSQGPGGAPVQTVFREPELMMPVRCAVHPWMQAFINGAANPFYAVSDATGHFAIKGLPPGTYTVVADQENLGQQTATVTVGAKQTVTQDFTYKGTAPH